MKTLEFKASISAPVKRVWDTMLNPDTYRQWTNVFSEGSYYEGTWEEGSKIYFLNPSASGMVGKIAHNKLYEFISIMMTGFVSQGKEDTESAEAKSWAPAYENYYFKAIDDHTTELRVTVDVAAEHEAIMTEPWLKAMVILKEMCENLSDH